MEKMRITSQLEEFGGRGEQVGVFLYNLNLITYFFEVFQKCFRLQISACGWVDVDSVGNFDQQLLCNQLRQTDGVDVEFGLAVSDHNCDKVLCDMVATPPGLSKTEEEVGGG